MKLAEEDFERKRQKINEEMLKYEQKLEKVTETLDGLKADLKNKEDEAEQIENKIESTKDKIKNQEEEINELVEETKILKVKEKEGIEKIDQLKRDIKRKVSKDQTKKIDRRIKLAHVANVWELDILASNGP